jgi:hypothetical protein
MHYAIENAIGSIPFGTIFKIQMDNLRKSYAVQNGAKI